MQVYQIIIYGEEGQTFVGDIYWSNTKAQEEAHKLSEDENLQHCNITIQPKLIKE